MAANTGAYPVVYEADMPERLSRWLWLVKWLLALPHFVVVGVLGFVMWFTLLFTWLAIVFTGKYPRGLFDFNLGVSRWVTRVTGYIWLLTDKYPPFSTAEVSEYPVRLKLEYPGALSRLKAFFRIFLAIPQLIVIGALVYVQGALLLVHIVVVVFTGKPNREVFRIIVGVARWNARVTQYCYLVTDTYPPFSFD